MLGHPHLGDFSFGDLVIAFVTTADSLGEAQSLVAGDSSFRIYRDEGSAWAFDSVKASYTLDWNSLTGVSQVTVTINVSESFWIRGSTYTLVQVGGFVGGELFRKVWASWSLEADRNETRFLDQVALELSSTEIVLTQLAVDGGPAGRFDNAFLVPLEGVNRGIVRRVVNTNAIGTVEIDEAFPQSLTDELVSLVSDY